MRYNPDFILTADNRNEAVNYLISIGYHAARLAIMGNLELVNTYHKEGWTRTPVANDIQRATGAAVIATIDALMNTVASEDRIREIINDQLAVLAPRKLEIVTPTTTTIIDGPVHYRTSTVLQSVSLGHAVMQVGPAGCGKTTIGEHVAKALNLPFYITNVVNEPHELTGFVNGHGRYHVTPFRTAFESGGVWIADEIDAWDAAALLAANSALANGYATFPDVSTPVRRHSNFRMVATANTFGSGADRVYVGRNELDAASLDRFAVIEVDYDLDLERMFAAGADRWLERVWQVRKGVQEKRIRHVVSSRAIFMGAAALSIGMAWDEVEEIYLWKGLPEKDRRKIDA